MYIGSFQFHSICKYKVDKAYILKNIYFFRRANLDGNQGILSILQLGEAIIQKNKAQLLLKVLRSEMMATIFGVFGPFQIRTVLQYDEKLDKHEKISITVPKIVKHCQLLPIHQYPLPILFQVVNKIQLITNQIMQFVQILKCHSHNPKNVVF